MLEEEADSRVSVFEGRTGMAGTEQAVERQAETSPPISRTREALAGTEREG